MLDWPDEIVGVEEEVPEWSQAGSNCCLDFHGDPLNADLVVFSDGNHHMALLETLQLFQKHNTGLRGVFYATTPPGPVSKLLNHGSLRIGNLVLSVRPHIFISPPAVLDTLVRDGHLAAHTPFMRNRGSVLLVKKGNPKSIHGVAELARPDLKLFMSNPDSEGVSFKGYAGTLINMAAQQGVDLSFLTEQPVSPKVVHGQRIHHREGPQAVADGRADVAIVYYHLALRYTRVFSSEFEIIPLGGTVQDPQPTPENVISLTHVGLIDHGGAWGAKFLDFLHSKAVHKIYQHHGLLPLE